MSKRAGTFVTLRDVVEQVGPDVTRFVMLTRKNDAPLDFDFDRCWSSRRTTRSSTSSTPTPAPSRCWRAPPRPGFATDDGALAAADLGRARRAGRARAGAQGGEWPRQVEIAAASHEPHRIAFYLYDLASEFHALQHQGKLEPELRFIREDAPELTRARLALVRATQVVIAAGLGILGVTPMEEMR